jgi:hypothetical protein
MATTSSRSPRNSVPLMLAGAAPLHVVDPSSELVSSATRILFVDPEAGLGPQKRPLEGLPVGVKHVTAEVTPSAVLTPRRTPIRNVLHGASFPDALSRKTK